mgnify:CR=1 FL=1
MRRRGHDAVSFAAAMDSLPAQWVKVARYSLLVSSGETVKLTVVEVALASGKTANADGRAFEPMDRWSRKAALAEIDGKESEAPP